MRLLKREALAWKKRYIFWALLIIVIVAGYLGHLGYPFYDVWHNNYLLLGDISFDDEVQENTAYSLLWKAVAARTVGNPMVGVVVLLLVGVSLGADLYYRRTEGRCFLGEKPKSIYGQSVCVIFLISLLLTVLPVGMVFWRMKELFAGHIMPGDMMFFVKPLIRQLLQLLTYISAAHLACVLFSRIHYLLGMGMSAVFFIVIEGLHYVTAEAYAVSVAGGRVNSLLEYYFAGVDTRGIERNFVVHVANEAAAQAYGNFLNIADLVLTVGMIVLAGVIFCRIQRKHLQENQSRQDQLEEKISRLNGSVMQEAGKVYTRLRTKSQQKEGRPDKCLYREDMDVRENLSMIGYSMKEGSLTEVENAVKLAGLEGQNERRKKLKLYTPDMRLRYEMAALLLAKGKCAEGRRLLLDTMAEGSDQEGIAEVRRAVSRLQEQGFTLYLTADRPDDLYAVTDYFLLPDQGAGERILTGETVERESRQIIRIQTDDRKRTEQVLNNLVPDQYSYDEETGYYVITSHTVKPEEIQKKLKSIGAAVKSIEREGRNVEEVFQVYER